MLNYNTTREGVTLRFGDSAFSTFVGTTINANELMLAPYGDTKLFNVDKRSADSSLDFYDAETGALVYATSPTANANTLSMTYLYFNKYLFLFSNAGGVLDFAGAAQVGFQWDGAVFGACAYTGAGLAPIGGNSYNHRSYLIQFNEAAYWYSPLDSIAGACTKIDLSMIVQQKCTLSCIGSFTLSDQVTTSAIQSFIFSNGEVLFYSGTYPNSADWRIIGTAKIGQPLAIQSTIAYQGDTLVMCDAGVVSLRDLFLKGSQAAVGLSVSDPVQKSWATLVKAMRLLLSNPVGPILNGFLVGNVRGVYDQATDRIIISFPYYMNPAVSATIPQVGSFYFVFDNQLQAWFFHRSFGGTVFDIVLYKNKVLTVGKNSNSATYIIWQKEGAGNFTDRNGNNTADVPFNYQVTTAPISNGRSYVQKGEGLDVILNSDLYAETSYQFVRDFGVLSTIAQKTSAPVSTLQKPFVNMGIEGSYIQAKISGTTSAGKVTGIQLYGMNFWIEQGEGPR